MCAGRPGSEDFLAVGRQERVYAKAHRGVKAGCSESHRAVHGG